MLGCLIFILKFCYVFVFLGFLGKRLRMHNLSYVCKLDYAHAVLFLRAQAVARNPNFICLLLLFSHVCAV